MENRARVTYWVTKVVSLIHILLTFGGRCRWLLLSYTAENSQVT